MTDLAPTIAAKSDQLNADDLMAGPRVITVTAVKDGSAEQPIAIRFDGDEGKPYYPCKSMRRVLVMTWGVDGSKYVGRSMRLYRDPDVMFGGIKVGGIRISHLSHIKGETELALTATRGKKKLYTVKPLQDSPRRPEEGQRVSTTPDAGSNPAGEARLKLVNSKGVVSELPPAKWRATLVKWLTDLPFDTAKIIHRDNSEHVSAAVRAGFSEDADAVDAAWQARNEETAEP